MEKKFEDNSSISYIGNVSVSILKGKNVIKTIKTHNKGYEPLFRFLCQCLAGEYNRAEALRPRYIRLFTLGDAGTAFVEEQVEEHLSVTYLTSLTIPTYNTTPSISTVSISGQEPYTKTTFKFLISFTQIDSTRDTNMFALYSADNQLDLTKPSAIFVLKDPNDPDLLSSVMTSSSSAKSNDYSLQIQWELSIQNA